MSDKSAIPLQEQMIYLARMECLTSCVLTYLNMNGSDYQLLLLDYWNFNYEKTTILSSKNANDLPLSYLYGVEINFVKGTTGKLEELIKQGDSVICLCKASKLDYFPRNFLAMESGGFWHAILIAGQEATGSYVVCDPVVNLITRLRPEELTAATVAKVKQDELLMFSLSQDRDGSKAPDIQEVLQHCSKWNLQQYKGIPKDSLPERDGAVRNEEREKWEIWRERFRKQTVSGLAAWKEFEKDLWSSASWPDARRSAWVKQNTMMISSIVQLRTKIWGIYKELAGRGEVWASEGQEHINTIIKLWNGLQLLMQKYDIRSKRETGSGIEAVAVSMGKIRDAELHFLDWLHHSLGKENHADAVG